MELVVLSLRYSSWSIRPWLALQAAGVDFKTTTVSLPNMKRQIAEKGGPIKVTLDKKELQTRRDLGSVRGLFPVLHVNGQRVYESLAICEYVADMYPEAGLWPENALVRSLARGACCEMLTGFYNVRDELSCHVFGRLDWGGKVREDTKLEIERVFELWRTCLKNKHDFKLEKDGPFLFGRFGIVDCFYFPVVTRFITYNVKIPADLQTYVDAILNHTVVKKYYEVARKEPEIEIYDDVMTSKGGNPKAGF